ncbi:MAG: apolipoprotein N-acyltransferase [Promicromonosporaceae bacterium]|nr:apolipoprotein N-acyltransferase [Promicromonosporaceae bacterium]
MTPLVENPPERAAGVPLGGPNIPRKLTIVCAFLIGGALWAAFPTAGLWPLGIVAVALVWIATGRDHAGWNFLVLFIAGLVFALPHVRWAYYATDSVPWYALSLLVALGFGVFGAVWTWAKRLPWVRDRLWAHLLAFATLWVAVEQWRSEFPFGGFPWGRLAWTVSNAPTGRAAWLGGTPFVSFLLAGAGVLLLVAFFFLLEAKFRTDVEHAHRWGKMWQGLTCVGIATVAVFGPALLPLPSGGDGAEADNLAFSYFVHADTGVAEAGVLRVGLVQGDSFDADGNTGRQIVLENHLAVTGQLAEDMAWLREVASPDVGLDVVWWPENSADFDPQVSPVVASWLDEAVAAVGAPILVGAMEWPEYGGRYNVLLLWQAGEGVISRYAKQLPAPFGEYIPLRNVARLLSDQVDRVQNDMWAATNPPLIHLPVARLNRDVPIGTAICFEVAYDRILRDATRLGAEVLVVPTNNASFGWTPQSLQQLQMTQLQAIANGRATVQISTVGVSAVIAPDGTIVWQSGLFESAWTAANLPLRTTLTPATLLGYWPSWLFSGAGALLALGGVATRWVRNRAESCPHAAG